MNKKFNIISNSNCWIEHTAIEQLENISNLAHVTNALGLPDLHAGKIPVGISVETADYVYPHLIGNDIGCGMSLFETSIKLKKYKETYFLHKLNSIKSLDQIPLTKSYDNCPIENFGTIGAGNHFAEFQKIEKIYDNDEFELSNIDKSKLFLLIHSGSRNFGTTIHNQFLNFAGITDQELENYLVLHDQALTWSSLNRTEVAKKLIGHLGYNDSLNSVVDCCHNYIEKRNNVFIHRKGTVSSENGLVIIPGSRGTLSYLVKPANDTAKSLFSLSHGAGRKWARSLCYSRIKNKYSSKDLTSTRLGSKVICHDRNLLFQEAPEAYKNIEQVIHSLIDYNLISIVATLRPLMTFKG